MRHAELGFGGMRMIANCPIIWQLPHMPNRFPDHRERRIIMRSNLEVTRIVMNPDLFTV